MILQDLVAASGAKTAQGGLGPDGRSGASLPDPETDDRLQLPQSGVPHRRLADLPAVLRTWFRRQADVEVGAARDDQSDSAGMANEELAELQIATMPELTKIRDQVQLRHHGEAPAALSGTASHPHQSQLHLIDLGGRCAPRGLD